ncbi:MAG: 3-dehydroquinate synthase, partial [Acidobacteria bacterium]|nr:3-dehydroquinate synthase [Acidobacteriota bacterium]
AERAGLVISLTASPETLALRLGTGARTRPLVSHQDEGALTRLLAARALHYASFPEQLDTDGLTPGEAAARVADLLVPRTLSIRSPGLSHDVIVGYGLLERLPALLGERTLSRPAVVVTDENVARCLGHRMPAGIPRLAIRPGEVSKTLETVGWLCDRFAALGLDRESLVLAIGGGVAGDVAGFAAATYMRGVRWVAVPTTLLAMVDASIGGKTGVNLPAGKNLVGAFHAPAAVFADPLVLATLPAAERVAGMAEVVKHAVIGDVDLLGSLESEAAFGRAAQLARAAAVKARVVEADPFEHGARAVLNFGHTIGHAIEAVSGFAVRHGEAVAIGMVAEARLAERIGVADPGLAARVASVLAHVGLPTAWSGADAPTLRRAMQTDKKRSRGTLRFALPVRLGRVDPRVQVAEADLMHALASVSDEARGLPRQEHSG